MTTEQQPGRPATEDAQPGWTTNGKARNREGPELGRAGTGEGHNRGSPKTDQEPGKPTEGEAHNREDLKPGRPTSGNNGGYATGQRGRR